MTWHWLLHIIGADNLSGPWYGFWSGFGSDIGEVAILGGAYSLLRKHNCHQRRCWRIGRHLVEGSPWCNRHHQQARPAPRPQRTDPVPALLAQLRDEMHNLAEATRAAVKP